MTEQPAEAEPTPSAGDDAIIAEMEAMIQEESAKESNAPDIEGEPEVEAATEEKAAEVQEAAEENPQEAVESEPDSRETAALARIQRAEEKSKAEIARMREELRAEVDGMMPHIEEFKRWQSLKDKASIDPAGVFMALGLDPERDASVVARAIWSLSPDAKKDPRMREAAQRALRERKSATELDELRAHNQRLEQRIQNWEAQQEQKAIADRYISGLQSSVGDSTPLVARMQEKDPNKAINELSTMAMGLIDQLHREPSPAEVVQALENKLKNELDFLGVDYDSVIRQTSEPVAEQKPAAEPVKASPKKADANESFENLSEAELDRRLEKELEQLLRGVNG